MVVAQWRVQRKYVLPVKQMAFTEAHHRPSFAIAARFKSQLKTRKRYADVLIAAQALTGRHILVTRNRDDFRDLLPSA